MGDASFLDDKKKYMDPKTKRIYTGKQWKAFANRGIYDIFDANWFKNYIEVKEDHKVNKK